jgi:hypothetical protein
MEPSIWIHPYPATYAHLLCLLNLLVSSKSSTIVLHHGRRASSFVVQDDGLPGQPAAADGVAGSWSHTQVEARGRVAGQT